MVGFSIRKGMDTTRIAVCPHCDGISVATYLPSMNCPKCNYPLFEQDLVYMPNIEDAYAIAEIIVAKKKARENGSDDYDS